MWECPLSSKKYHLVLLPYIKYLPKLGRARRYCAGNYTYFVKVSKKNLTVPPAVSRNLVHFLMYIFSYLCHNILMSWHTYVTVGDGFASLGPPLLPWENCMGRGYIYTQTFRLLNWIGPVGRVGEEKNGPARYSGIFSENVCQLIADTQA